VTWNAVREVSSKTILVAGGAGYVGSHVCKALADAGFTPVVYDNLSRGHDWAVRFGPLERGDITDRARLIEVFARYRPAAVMHFAALADVPESLKRPELYYNNNVAGTLTLLDAMVEAGVTRIVFSSTCAVYGPPPRLPMTEDLPLAPISPYGRSKRFAEQILLDYSAAHGLAVASLRYFNAAGAAPEAGIGEDHRPERHLIPLALDVAAGFRSSISVFGEDYPTPDGTCIRDYIHVMDLAEAHIRALDHLRGGRGNLTVNLGTGVGYSVREVIDAVEHVTGRRVTRVSRPRRPGDPPVLVADASRARDVLGWVPARSGIKAQVEDAWRWHRIHSPRAVA
jgi:UDP-arabinose 4-epimerase